MKNLKIFNKITAVLFAVFFVLLAGSFLAVPKAHATTTNFAGNTADVMIRGYSESDYGTAHSTSFAIDAVSGDMTVGQGLFSGYIYQVYRDALKFDTSAIPDNAVVTQVNMTLTSDSDSSSVDFDVQIVKYDWSASDPVTTGNMSTVYSGILAGTADDNIWRNTSGISVETQYTSGNLNTAWVNKTGYTYYGLRSNRDKNGTAPDNWEYLSIGSQENYFSADHPKLTVTYIIPVAPTITTPTQTSITATGATLGGNVTSDGGATVTGRGVCVGASANPAIGGTCFTTTGTTGVFTVAATSLSSGTLYHYRAYATNSVGTSYTTDDSFTTLNINPTGTTTSAQTGLYSYYVTLNGAANPNGYATIGHFRVFSANPSNCNSDSGGIRFPALSASDIVVGSDSASHNFSYTIPFNSGTFLTPNTTYYYCSYALGGTNGITLGSASSIVSFFTPFGQASPCDAPMTGNLALPASSACSFGATYDGVDAGSGTTNTASITLSSGTQLTVNPGQVIGRGGIALSGGTLVLGGGGLLRGGVYVHDADGDGVLDDNLKYVGTAPSAGYIRRTAFQSTATNSAALVYSSNINAIATFDCNPSSAYAYRNISNLVKDADQDGYKTATAASPQCVGASAVINGRTYYNDGSGPN